MAIDMKKYTLTVNAFEGGVLMGLLEKEGDHVKKPLADVWKQLVAIKKEIEKAEGVTKEVLPGGLLKITDRDGNTIVREPYSWEIEGN